MMDARERHFHRRLPFLLDHSILILVSQVAFLSMVHVIHINMRLQFIFYVPKCLTFLHFSVVRMQEVACTNNINLRVETETEAEW